MKKYIFIFNILFCISKIEAQQNSNLIVDPTAPIMQFDSLIKNFGSVMQGTIVTKEYLFTNAGKSPLVISEVHGSGGGCVPNYPKEPIAPGKSGIIKLIFNTNGKMGNQDKTVTINSNNSDGTIVLHITGTIIPYQITIDSNAAVITFDSTSYHFGKIPQGEIVKHEFHFTNTGKSPIIITTANTTCGCDVAEYPKDPILPGRSGIIKYELLTDSRMGMQNKTITIVYNTDQVLVLQIFGEIIPKQ